MAAAEIAELSALAILEESPANSLKGSTTLTSEINTVRRRDRLGGLLHEYQQVA